MQTIEVYHLVVQIMYFLVISLIINYHSDILGLRKSLKLIIKRTPLMEETYIGRVMKAEEDIIERAKVKS